MTLFVSLGCTAPAPQSTAEAPAEIEAASPATTAPSEAERAALARDIRDLVSEFWDAWSMADVDRGMSFFHEEATVVTKGADILRGRTTVDAAWRPMFSTIQRQVIELTESHVTVFGPELATAQQKGTFRTTFADGSTGDHVPFSFTEVWMRTDDGWRIIATHRSDPTPPGER